MSNSPEKVARIVNIALPLQWALGIAAGAIWGLVQTYFTVNTLVRTVEELQITVKSGNTALVSLQSEMTLLRFRQDNADAAIKALQVRNGGKP